MKNEVQKIKFPYVLFIIFLILEIGVFLSHKMVSNNSSGDGLSFYLDLMTKPWILISMGLALMQFFFWTRVLAKANLSLAYSLSSISYPITMIAACFIFKEQLPIIVWIGGIIITIGVIIIGLEEEQEEKAC